jgi:AcrR family transcriptional regulator
VPRIWDESVASHKVRLRAAIIDAAVELVRARGRGDVSLAAVAERAGIGRATVYNYFPDLDHILAAFVADSFDGFHDGLDGELAAFTDPLDRLQRAVALSVGYLASSQHRTDAVVGLTGFAPEAQRRVDAAVAGFHDRLGAVVGEAVAAGLLRDDVEATFLTHALHHLLAAARVSVLAGEQDAEQATAAVLAVFLRGSATPRARRRRQN